MTETKRIQEKTLLLKTGFEIPVLGLGTWELGGQKCRDAVRLAIELGYRHIDTAELYGNEAEIGNAIEDFDRTRLFITSKVASSHLAKKDVPDACNRSLDKLGTDYLDLYLIHWPNDEIPLEETLEAMCELVEKNYVRSIGLSNFDVERTKKAISISSEPITNLQIEFHPFTHRHVLPEFCRDEGITITAYSPLARGAVFKDETLVKIAEKYDKTPAQLSLKWLIQKGYIVIPKASSKEHLVSNMQIVDWQIDEKDMSSIDQIQHEQRLVDFKYT